MSSTVLATRSAAALHQQCESYQATAQAGCSAIGSQLADPGKSDGPAAALPQPVGCARCVAPTRTHVHARTHARPLRFSDGGYDH